MQVEGASVGPLRLPLRHSALIWAVLCTLHLLPLVVASLPQVPSGVLPCLLVWAAISAAWHWRRSRRYQDACLCLGADGSAFYDEGGKAQPIEVLSSSKDLGWLIVVHWKLEADGRFLDWAWSRASFNPHTWRQLRIWLRWHAGFRD